MLSGSKGECDKRVWPHEMSHFAKVSWTDQAEPHKKKAAQFLAFLIFLCLFSRELALIIFAS